MGKRQKPLAYCSNCGKRSFDKLPFSPCFALVRDATRDWARPSSVVGLTRSHEHSDFRGVRPAARCCPVLLYMQLSGLDGFCLNHLLQDRCFRSDGRKCSGVSQELLGHKTIAITVRYSHLAPQHTLYRPVKIASALQLNPDCPRGARMSFPNPSLCPASAQAGISSSAQR